MAKVINLFKGFEGEAELTLISRDRVSGDAYTLNLWYGHFDVIMRALFTVLESNAIKGVPYHYQKVSGWYDEDEWECEDPMLFMEQIKKLEHFHFESDVKLVEGEILKLLQFCIRSKQKLIFAYF